MDIEKLGSLKEELIEIGSKWNWDNFETKEGDYYSFFEALNNKINWVIDAVEAHVPEDEREEYLDILSDTIDTLIILNKYIVI